MNNITWRNRKELISHITARNTGYSPEACSAVRDMANTAGFDPIFSQGDPLGLVEYLAHLCMIIDREAGRLKKGENHE